MGRILDISERIILVLLFAAFAWANWRSEHLANLLVLATEAMTVFFILIRRQAFSISAQPVDWLLALGGTMLPLFARPGGQSFAPEVVGIVAMIGGAVVSAAAKLSLNRRFGIAPANRGVQRNWAYSIVRHPMYVGYFVAQFGYLLINPSLWNIGLYLAAWGLQFGRILREERWLLTDPEYQAYAASVRFRLVPGVF